MFWIPINNIIAEASKTGKSHTIQVARD